MNAFGKNTGRQGEKRGADRRHGCPDGKGGKNIIYESHKNLYNEIRLWNGADVGAVLTKRGENGIMSTGCVTRDMYHAV